MDKGGRGGKGKGAARSRASSSSGSSSNKTSKGKTPTTASLETEATRVAAMAAAADAKAKAHQRKMTEFVQGQGQGRPQDGAGELASGPSGPALAAQEQGQAQGQDTAPQDGAGELGTGPSGPAAVATATTIAEETTPGTPKQVQFVTQAEVHQAQDPQGAGKLGTGPSNPGGANLRKGDGRSLAEQAAAIQAQLRSLRDQAGQPQAQEEEIAVVEVVPPQGQQEQQEGGWQQYVSRKNRKIGGQVEYQRQAREPTPFRLPGHQHPYQSRGYYTSNNERNRVRMDQERSNRSSVVAALTPRQWDWYKRRVCLACGADHQVKDCRAVTRDEGFALVRATRNCPVGMCPLPLAGRNPRDRDRPQGQRVATAPTEATPATSASAGAAAAGTPARTSKRPREQATGITPEAKKAKQFSEAAKESLTLYVREKDGSGLTEERYVSLKTSFTYYVEDLMAKDKDPPICGGRWTYSRAVVKIPMAGEEDLLFMRCFLDKSYLVQNGEDYMKSKGSVYVAFLRDRMEPELTGMRPDKLASFVRFFKRSSGIEGLFELKMAFKTPRGKAVHLVMDDKAEEIFNRAGRKIFFASAGFIEFEERARYIARIREQEKAKRQPRASVLEQGLREQQVDLGEMSVKDPEDKGTGTQAQAQEQEQVQQEAAEEKGEKQKPPTDDEVARAKEIAAKVGQGMMSAWRATQAFLEETGRDLEEVAPVFRRTASGSSWSEEVEHAKGLEVPATVAEEEPEEADGADKDDDDQDFAMFELFDSRAEGSGVNPEGHRAAGPADPAQGAPN